MGSVKVRLDIEVGLNVIDRITVSVVNNVGLFGVSVVFLILCAENLQSLLADAAPQMNQCLWTLVANVCLFFPISKSFSSFGLFVLGRLVVRLYLDGGVAIATRVVFSGPDLISWRLAVITELVGGTS